MLVPAFVRLCIPQKVQTGKYQNMKRRFKTEQSDAFSVGTLHFGDICLSVHLFILFLQEMLNFVASYSSGVRSFSILQSHQKIENFTLNCIHCNIFDQGAWCSWKGKKLLVASRDNNGATGFVAQR